MTWRPHPEGDRRRASAACLAAAVLATDGLTDAHRRYALDKAIWLYTEADGKSNTRFRSAAAVDVRDPKLLNHEHVIPRRVLIDEMLAEPGRCAEIMAKAVGCVVLREENRRLTEQDRAKPGLEGWERYRVAGIEIVDLAMKGTTAA